MNVFRQLARVSLTSLAIACRLAVAERCGIAGDLPIVTPPPPPGPPPPPATPPTSPAACAGNDWLARTRPRNRRYAKLSAPGQTIVLPLAKPPFRASSLATSDHVVRARLLT